MRETPWESKTPIKRNKLKSRFYGALRIVMCQELLVGSGQGVKNEQGSLSNKVAVVPQRKGK